MADGLVDVEGIGNTADICYVVDADQRIVLWNRQAAKFFGRSETETLGRPCWEIVCGLRASGRRFCKEHCSVAERAEDGETVANFDLFTRDGRGRPLALNVGTVVLSDSDNAPLVVHYARRLDSGRGGKTRVSASDSAAAAAAALRHEPFYGLSRRELQVLALVSKGLSTGGIATTLGISPATVRNHVQNLMGKMGVHGRVEAIAEFTRRGGASNPGLVDKDEGR